MREKQRRFALAYVEKADIKVAALSAGYSKSYADKQAYKLLENEEITSFIAKRLREIESEKIANAKELMEYLTAVVRDETKEEVVVTEGAGQGFSEARIVEKRLSGRDRLKAIDLLFKRIDMAETEDSEQTNIYLIRGEKK